MLKRHKAFRFRAYPATAQVAQAEGWSRSLGWLWNIALEQRLLAYARPKCERRYPTAVDQQKELTELRTELPWLTAVPRNVCDHLLAELDAAWQRCFAGLAKQPRFKKRGRDVVNLYEPHPNCWRLEGQGDRKRKDKVRSKRDACRKAGYLHFPKIDGTIRLVVHRQLEGKPKTCALVRDGDQWFAVITCEITVTDPKPRPGPVVAVDRGIVHFGATSDGTYIPNPRFGEAAQKQVARAQRKLARKRKGSSNYNKQRACAARKMRKARRQRHHHLHVESSRLAKSHGVVVLENLNVAGMIRGNCARSIADVGWSMFGHFCRYKLDWSGGHLAEERAAYSSQECRVCSHVDAKSRRSQRLFVCTKCGHTENADVNAAKVLLNRYLTRANRSGLPVEGSVPPEGSLRSRKAGGKVVLRKVRRSSGSSARPRPLGLG